MKCNNRLRVVNTHERSMNRWGKWSNQGNKWARNKWKIAQSYTTPLSRLQDRQDFVIQVNKRYIEYCSSFPPLNSTCLVLYIENLSEVTQQGWGKNKPLIVWLLAQCPVCPLVQQNMSQQWEVRNAKTRNEGDDKKTAHVVQGRVKRSEITDNQEDGIDTDTTMSIIREAGYSLFSIIQATDAEMGRDMPITRWVKHQYRCPGKRHSNTGKLGRQVRSI